jgi:uncharacterized protein (TIGR02001 family)
MAPARPDDLRFGASAAVTSDYVYRGVTRSRGQPAAQIDLHLRPLEDWTVGVWASQVQLLAGRQSAEADLYTQWRWLLPRDFSASAGAVYYTFPGDPRAVSYSYAELNANLQWRERLTLTATWTPKVALFGPGYGIRRDRRAWSAELTGSQRLPGGLVALAGIGYFDAPGLPHAGYAYGSAGVMRRFGHWRAELTYIRVQAAEHRRFTSGAAGGPLSASLAWQF